MPKLDAAKRNGNWRNNDSLDPNSKRLCDMCGLGLAPGYVRHPNCRDWHEAILRAEHERKIRSGNNVQA